MPVTAKINGIKGLEEYFRKLLESGKVDEILTCKLNSAGDNYVQTLISSPEMLENIAPFAPVIPVQTGRIAKNLTFTNSGKKILITAKPCEIKAIVELVKFKQVNLEDVFLVAVDCAGTYELNDFQDILRENKEYVDKYAEIYAKGDIKPLENYSFRKSCEICESPTVDINLVDAVLCCYGVEGSELVIAAKDTSSLADTIENAGVDLSKREEIVDKITKNKLANKEKVLSEFREKTASLEALQKIFSKCIRCHNCMVACPICYCKECVFRSPTFDHSADMITTWAERKGGLRMLENTLMFHLTRLNHMSSSCIGCGLCSSACPNDIDVSTLFISVSDNVQSMLEYKAGKSFEEPAPVTTFRENELVVEAGTNE